MTKKQDNKLAESINALSESARTKKEDKVPSDKLFQEAAAALALTNPGISKSTITDLMNHALQSDATPPAPAEQLTDTKQLLADVMKDTIEQTAANEALKQITELRSHVAQSLEELAEKKDKYVDLSDPLTPGRERVKRMFGAAATNDKPFNGSDWRGIQYSKKLVDKANESVLQTYGSTEAFRKAVCASQRGEYHPHCFGNNSPVSEANLASFDKNVYNKAFDAVFYLTTNPQQVAYNEAGIMPPVINKIRHYERIHGTADVLTPEARNSLIGALLSTNLGEGYYYMGYVDLAQSYPKEMCISAPEATHIYRLIATLSTHREFTETGLKVYSSPLTIKEQYDSLSKLDQYGPRGIEYDAKEAYRKLNVWSNLMRVVIPTDISRELIDRKVVYDSIGPTSYAIISDASARLRRAATVFIEGGSFADLLVAIGNYSLAIRVRYNEIIESVDDSMNYLTANGLTFTEIFKDSASVHKRTFNKTEGVNSGEWGGSPW